MPVENLTTSGTHILRILINLFVITMTFQKNLYTNLEYCSPRVSAGALFLRFIYEFYIWEYEFSFAFPDNKVFIP